MLQGQRPTISGDGGRGKPSKVNRDTSRTGSSFLNNILQADTLEIEYYHAHHPDEFTPYPDSMLGNNFQKPDPPKQAAAIFSL